MIIKEDCLTEGCPENYTCCAGCIPAMCTKLDLTSYVNVNDSFYSLKQTNTSWKHFDEEYEFEDIPNGSIYCVPKQELDQECHWVKDIDGKFREKCWNNLVYREVCYQKS